MFQFFPPIFVSFLTSNLTFWGNKAPPSLRNLYQIEEEKLLGASFAAVALPAALSSSSRGNRSLSKPLGSSLASKLSLPANKRLPPVAAVAPDAAG